MDYREQYIQRAAIAASEQSRLATEIEQTNEDIALLEDANAQCNSGYGDDGCSADDVERRGREIRDLRAQRRAMERALASSEASADLNRQLAETAPSATDSNAGGITGSWPSTPAYPPSYAVADAVKEITLSLIEADNGVQMCFEFLRKPENAGTPLWTHCDKVMAAYVKQVEAGKTGYIARSGSKGPIPVPPGAGTSE
jgi:hypothetical protein